MKPAFSDTNESMRGGWNGVRRMALLLTGLLASQLLTGCAQFMAFNQPSPMKPGLAVGEKRLTVMAQLGRPLTTEQHGSMLTDVYRYTDGGTKNNALSKTARILVYTGGDLFTVWLDQVIWMPLEAFGFKGTIHAVTIDFSKAVDESWEINHVDDRITKGSSAN